jgi:endoglucanase
MNGETLHPDWAVHIVELTINGEPYKMTGRPYTTSDDGKCTRVNLVNEWVTAIPGDARVLYGPLISVSPTVLNRNDDVISHIETISVTFVYEQKK